MDNSNIIKCGNGRLVLAEVEVRNRKLFWKEVSNAKGGNVESCSRVEDGNRRLAQVEGEARKIWKEYFEDMCNILRKRLQSTCVILMEFGEVTSL